MHVGILQLHTLVYVSNGIAVAFRITGVVGLRDCEQLRSSVSLSQGTSGRRVLLLLKRLEVACVSQRAVA